MPSLLVNVLIVQYGQWEKCAIKYKVHIVITELSKPTKQPYPVIFLSHLVTQSVFGL